VVTLSIRLQGHPWPLQGGGPAGDLVLQVQVEPHSVFHRSGDTLEVTLPVSLSEAIEGAKVDVPTPWGTIVLRIPPGTSSGKKLRAAGMGVHHGNGAKGDLIAEVQIMLPPVGDPALRERLADAAKVAETATPENVRSRLQW